MKTLIRDATIFSPQTPSESATYTGSVLIERDSIVEIGSNIDSTKADRVIDGSGKLVMPGLVNAHFHSFDMPFKGQHDNLPLELWMLYHYPVLGFDKLSPDFVYLRTLVLGLECLKAGITTVVDDILELPGQDLESLDAAFRAYDALGMRANVSGSMINRPLTDTIPFARECLPDDLYQQLNDTPPPSTQDYLDFTRTAIDQVHLRSDRLRYVIAPSGPQRCTDDLLVASHELALNHHLAYHTHVLETKMQAVSGTKDYRKSLIEHMNELDILSPRTAIAHSIWVTSRDIELIAEAGASVVHNPICNLKLGAGIAPYRALRDAGINMGLGSDAISANDSPRFFDVMKLAAMLHNITTPDFTKWPTVSEILYSATLGGAQSASINEVTGSLEVGKKADLLILDLESLAFTPLNSIANQLVYCENGSSIEVVMVDGEIVVEDGTSTYLDEGEIKREFRTAMREFAERFPVIQKYADTLAPAFAEIHTRAAAEDMGMTRLALDAARP